MAENNDLECGIAHEEKIKRSQTPDADISKEPSAATAPSIQLNRDQQIASAEEDDPNIVGWDGPDDPENPKVRAFPFLPPSLMVATNTGIELAGMA